MRINSLSGQSFINLKRRHGQEVRELMQLYHANKIEEIILTKAEKKRKFIVEYKKTRPILDIRV